MNRFIGACTAIIGLTLLFVGCARHNVRHVSTAFYYWRTEFALSGEEKGRLGALGANRLYVRVFDVDWDIGTNMAYPVQTLRGHLGTTVQADIVPTVFITNRTFTNLPPSEVTDLAEKIFRLSLSMSSTLGFSPIHELQLDCDWSEYTRGKYFRLADELRRLLREQQISLSATIRLHQIKYRERVGVPPVDRGVLMFYNMGELNSPDAANSILDLAAARTYIPYIDEYPLNLDVALPLYSWGAVYRRARMVELINNVTQADFPDHATFAAQGNKVRVLKGSFFRYRFLYAGDVIRLESVTIDQLLDAASLLTKHFASDSLRVIFYHLDAQAIRGYRNEDLQTVCAAFR